MFSYYVIILEKVLKANLKGAIDQSCSGADLCVRLLLL